MVTGTSHMHMMSIHEVKLTCTDEVSRKKNWPSLSNSMITCTQPEKWTAVSKTKEGTLVSIAMLQGFVTTWMRFYN